MGRIRIFKLALVAALVQSLTFQAQARPPSNGFTPLEPKADIEGRAGQSNATSGEDGNEIELPPKRSPRVPSIRIDNSSRGFRVSGVDISIADVAEEFACPIFENKAYETILDSLNKLNNAMGASIQCVGQQSMTSMVDNTKQVREAVETIRPYFDSPELAFQNVKEVEDSVTKAVTGVDSIVAALGTTNMVQPQCANQVFESGGIVNAVTNLISGISPFALLGISLVPGLSAVVKTSAFALIAGTSAVKEYQKLVYSRTLHMDNHEHWKAVIQNTCAYSRVARKLNYINNYDSGLIPMVIQKDINSTNEILPEEVKIRSISFEKKNRSEGGEASKYMTISNENRNSAATVNSILKNSRMALADYSSQIDDAKTNQETACTVGLEISNSALNGSGFPSDLISVAKSLKEMNSNLDSKSYMSLVKTYERLVDGLNSLTGPNLMKSSMTADCAAKSMALIDNLNRITKTFSNLSKNIENARESELMKDPDYRRWKDEFKTVENQKRMGRQLYSVMREISHSGNWIKTYLTMRQNTLKAYLFGTPGFATSTPPVALWLDYTLNLHKKAISDFAETIGLIKTSLYNLKARELDKKGKSTLQDDSKLKEALQAYQTFEGLDLKSFNMNDAISAREHDLVCLRMQNAWKLWTEATNYIDSVGVFCEMIDPLIDISTNSTVVKFCRGSNEDISYRQNITSKVGDALKTLNTKNFVYGNRSTEEMAIFISDKINSLKCKLSR